jgi:hypothetical protein
MANPITDPALLAKLEASDAPGKPVTDPKLLAALEGDQPQAHEGGGGKWTDRLMSGVEGAKTAAKFATGVSEAPVSVAAMHASDEKPLQTLDNYARGVANGATLGFGDRFAAGMGSATGVGGTQGDYAGNLERERARNKEMEDAEPIANTAANLVGGAMVPMGAVGAATSRAGLLAKSLMGAGAGAGIGAVQGLSGTQDLTNVPDAAKNTGKGAAIGFGIGGILPGSGKLIGKGYNAIADALMSPEGISRGASKHLIDALMADGAPAVQQRMGSLGQDAMLADGGFALQGKASGAALNNDEARSTVFSALKGRDEGTNKRIVDDVERALGPAEDPVTVSGAIRDHRTAVDSVAYPAALDNAPAVRTAPILQQLDDMIPRSVGNERKALTNLRDMMMTTERRQMVDAQGHPQYDRLGNERFQEVPVSQNDAGVLHKVKQELDNVIEYDQPGLGVQAGALTRQQGALKNMRGQLNDALENQVPGYLQANRQSAALARRGTAVELGTQYLGSGKTTASPGRFADEFQRLEPGEQIAFAQGSRGNIDRALGTKANDLQALRSELQGEGGWNTAKIATVHGQPAADELVGTVDRNLKFRDTHNKVVENAQTAQRTAAKEAMSPAPPGELPIINPNMSYGGAALSALKKYVAQPIYHGLQSDPTRHYGEIARVVTAQGSERDRYLAALVDALGKHSQNAAAAPAIGNRAALAAGLLGNEYVHDRTNMRQ